MKAWTVAGYTYQAETLCPGCTLESLPTGPGEQFDGWQDLSGMSAEDNLRELALSFGIDREDENTFDSDDFPKVIFASQVDGDACGRCGVEL